MIRDTIQIIGCGQCGTRLGLEFAKLGVDIYYINSDEHDVRGTSIDPKKMLLLGDSGTGASTIVGKKMMEDKWEEFKAFVSTHLDPSKVTVVICGLGGGTGGSVSPLILEYLSKLEMPDGKRMLTGCLATLPPNMLDILASGNALKTLKVLKDLKIDMFMLADNEFLTNKVGIGGNWWEKVNQYIVKEFNAIFELLSPGKITQTGIGSIDKGELLRILQFGNGLIDIRTMYFNYQDFKVEDRELSKTLFTSSLIKGFNYKTTLAYLVGIEVPKRKPFTVEAKRIFDIVKKVNGSAISRLGMSVDPGLSDVMRVTLVNTGLKLPKELQTRINNLKRDEGRFRDKKIKKETINLSDVDTDIFEEDFQM